MSRVFNLMALPAELRLKVYGFALPEIIHLKVDQLKAIPENTPGFTVPLFDQIELLQDGRQKINYQTYKLERQTLTYGDKKKARDQRPSGHVHHRQHRAPPRPVPSLLPLLLTSKTVSIEALPLIYERVELRGKSIMDLVLFGRAIGPGCQWIRKVAVDIPDIWDPDCGISFAIVVSRKLKVLVRLYDDIRYLNCSMRCRADYTRNEEYSYEEVSFFTGIMRESYWLNSCAIQVDGDARYSSFELSHTPKGDVVDQSGKASVRGVMRRSGDSPPQGLRERAG